MIAIRPFLGKPEVFFLTLIRTLVIPIPPEEGERRHPIAMYTDCHAPPEDTLTSVHRLLSSLLLDKWIEENGKVVYTSFSLSEEQAASRLKINKAGSRFL